MKAVYQRYLGWFDGNPSSLWEHPPEASATRYVACLGGIDEVVAKARAYADDGDLRFAAQLLKHAVFAEPDHPGRPGAAGRRLPAAGLRRGERHLAQLLPPGRPRARGRGSRPNPPGGRGRRADGRPERGAAVRLDRHPHRRLRRAGTTSFAIDWGFTDLGRAVADEPRRTASSPPGSNPGTARPT